MSYSALIGGSEHKLGSGEDREHEAGRQAGRQGHTGVNKLQEVPVNASQRSC